MTSAACCRDTDLNLASEALAAVERIEALAADPGASRGLIIAAAAVRELRGPLEAQEFWMQALLEARREWYARGRADGRAETMLRVAGEDARPRLRAVGTG